MSSLRPLNLAVIAEALDDLRNGQLRRCEAMGFSAADLEALKHPNLVSVLINAQVSWCSVRVNSAVLQRLLAQAENIDKEIHTIDRMLRLGASTEMVSDLYGLSHQEVALRRQVLKLPQRLGRWPVLSEEQDTTLWERWHGEVQARKIELRDDATMLTLGMDLAESMNLPLAVVWSSIVGWIEQGLT